MIRRSNSRTIPSCALLLVVFAFTGCPLQQPEPLNSIEFIHDLSGRIVTELRLGVGTPDDGYTFGDNLLDEPLLFNESLLVMDLPDGYYVVEIVSTSTIFPGSREADLDIGFVGLASEVTINLSVLN